MEICSHLCEHKQNALQAGAEPPPTDTQIHSYRLANTSQLQVQSCRPHLISLDVFRVCLFFSLSPFPCLSLFPPADGTQKAFSLSAIISEGFSGQSCFLTKDERQTYRESIHFLETGTRPYLHSAFLCLC